MVKMTKQMTWMTPGLTPKSALRDHGVPATKARYHQRHLVSFTMFTKYFMVIHTK
jgi:hypothetical protein